MIVKMHIALDAIIHVPNVSQKSVDQVVGVIGDGVMTMLMCTMKELS